MKIVVFGSINMDLTTYVPRLPRPGETLRGSSFITVPGGKGSNQAVAAARLGAEVVFIGRVGRDSFGPDMLRIVSEQNVDMSQVELDENHNTGLAIISVDENAENSIIIVSGANLALDESDVAKTRHALENAKVLMVQLETNLDPVLQAIKIAREMGVTVIFDPAPASALPEIAFQHMDFITPNEVETETLVGFRPKNASDAEKAAHLFREKGVRTAIIKLGAQGAYFHGPEGSGFQTPFKVAAIDTVAAGDAFNGALAVALSEGRPISEAVRWGAAAGALATTRKGAMPAMPSREELLKLLEEQS